MSQLGHYAEEYTFLHTKYIAHEGRVTFEYQPCLTPASAANGIMLWEAKGYFVKEG